MQKKSVKNVLNKRKMIQDFQKKCLLINNKILYVQKHANEMSAEELEKRKQEILLLKEEVNELTERIKG